MDRCPNCGERRFLWAVATVTRYCLERNEAIWENGTTRMWLLCYVCDHLVRDTGEQPIERATLPMLEFPPDDETPFYNPWNPTGY